MNCSMVRVSLSLFQLILVSVFPTAKPRLLKFFPSKESVLSYFALEYFVHGIADKKRDVVFFWCAFIGNNNWTSSIRRVTIEPCALGAFLVQSCLCWLSSTWKQQLMQNFGTCGCDCWLMCAASKESALLFFALYLVDLGSAGVKSALPSHGADQFDENDRKESSQMSSFFNWLLLAVCVCGAISVTHGLDSV